MSPEDREALRAALENVLWAGAFTAAVFGVLATISVVNAMYVFGGAQ